MISYANRFVDCIGCVVNKREKTDHDFILTDIFSLSFLSICIVESTLSSHIVQENKKEERNSCVVIHLLEKKKKESYKRFKRELLVCHLMYRLKCLVHLIV